MQSLTIQQIDFLPWYALGIFWAISAMRLKATKQTESWQASAFNRIIMAGAFVLLFSQRVRVGFLGQRLLPQNPILQWTGVALTFAGASLAIWARLSLGENWSSVVSLKVRHELIRRGPFAYVRHPIYAGLLLAVAGTAIQIGEWGGFVAIALTAIAYWLKAQREEQFLVAEFGEGYTRYRQSTGFLVPKLPPGKPKSDLNSHA